VTRELQSRAAEAAAPERQKSPALLPLTGVLQRKCACGGAAGATGACDDCEKEKSPLLQRKAAGAPGLTSAPPIVHQALRSPGKPLDRATGTLMKSALGHDFGSVRIHHDQQAARSARAVSALAYTVGENVVFGAGRYAPHTPEGRGLLAHELTHVVQQRSGLASGASELRLEAEADRHASQVSRILNSPGRPLDPGVRTEMAARFGPVQAPVTASADLTVNRPGDRWEQEADRAAARAMQSAPAEHPGEAFTNVRVHDDPKAAESAKALHAQAYTVGDDIVFAAGKYAPSTAQGRHLLAHELAHTLQPVGMIRRKWDDAPDCKSQPADKWIKTVTVNQEGSETATIEWSDGSTESDQCSSGKGHCCVDSSNASGVACTVEGSHADGSNCTPITQRQGYPVKNRVLDHSGVNFWTEFVPDRAIALHEYSPIDGTPLSHGCVRLHTEMAKKIFCGVRQNQTWVKVLGFARPKCDNTTLQNEWLSDFSTAGMAKPDGITTAGEIAEARKEMNAAFGRTVKPDEFAKMTAADIPRCKSSAPLPQPPAGTGTNP
jgi:hypothetical protein